MSVNVSVALSILPDQIPSLLKCQAAYYLNAFNHTVVQLTTKSQHVSFPHRTVR